MDKKIFKKKETITYVFPKASHAETQYNFEHRNYSPNQKQITLKWYKIIDFFVAI